MNKRSLVLLVVAIVSSAVVPTMADTCTWLGTNSNSWTDANNWANGVMPQAATWAYDYDVNGYVPVGTPDMLINSGSKTNSITWNDDGVIWRAAATGTIYDSYQGTFSVNGSFILSGANVAAGATLNIDKWASQTIPSPFGTLQLAVAPTGTVNLGGGYYTYAGALSGGGTVNSFAGPYTGSRTQSWTVNASTLNIITDGCALTGLSGNGIVNIQPDAAGTATSPYNFFTISSAGFNFTGQINAAAGVVKVDGPVSNMKLHLDPLSTFVAGGNTLTACTISGGAGGSGGNYGNNGNTALCTGSGSGGTAVLAGCTLAPSGVMNTFGNLVLAKNGTTKGQLQIAVTGDGGGAPVAGTHYTQLSLGGNWVGAPYWDIDPNTCRVSSGSDPANPLADTNLVVNIARGLTPKNVQFGAACNLWNDTMTIVQSQGSNALGLGQTWGNGFANVTFVGGTATVNYTTDANGKGVVILTNIWSNPTLDGDINNDGLVDVADYNIWAANVGKTGTNWGQGDLNGDGLVDVADYNIWAANVGKTAATPEPISMIILAIGGGMVAIRRNRD